MKTIIALIFLSVITSNISYAYDKYGFTYDDTTKIIEQIREQYKTVNTNQTKYRLLEKDLMGETTEGGFLVAYIDQQDIRKVITTYYGETGKAITEYYFNHGDLFFSLVKEYHYNKPIDQPGSKIASVKEDRHYFSNNKMIRWLRGNAPQKSNTISYKDEATNSLNQAKKILSYVSNCHSKLIKSSAQDTIRCKYGSDCPSTGYILKGSRNSCGEAIHVKPKNTSVQLEK
jgi:hypothetical protein